MKNDMLRITKRTISLFAVITIAVILSIVAVGWWVASQIDKEASEEQSRLAASGLDALVQELPKTQESVTIWNDAVEAARANDEAWLSENLVEWMGEFYGYQRVYLLDASDRAVRAARDGKLVPDTRFLSDERALAPLIEALRRDMAQAVVGRGDTNDALSTVFVSDFVAFPDGSVAGVSIRPLVGTGADPVQSPGTEYLQVVAQTLNDDVSKELGNRFGLRNLAFIEGDRAREIGPWLQVRNKAGEVLGGFTWTPHRPAGALLKAVGPFAVAGLVCAGLLVILLMIRLRGMSDDLAVSKAKAQHMAFYDSLTGIPNRALFQDRLVHALEVAKREGAQIAVHYLDLDGFKNVNDTLGHPVGDRLLVEVAKRLVSIGRASDTIARLSGDEFAIIQTGVANDNDAEILSRRVIDELGRPFDLDGDHASVGASIGVALSRASDSGDDMLRKADIALYQAKENGRGCFQVFVEDMDDIVRKRRAIGRELRRALERQEDLQFVYEPIHGARKGDLVGVQAQLRWEHSDYTGVRSEIIVAIAETSGLITQLGEYALNAICAFAASCNVPWVSVPMTPAHFQNERLADRILEIISAHGIDPGRVCFEIRNGERLRHSQRVRNCLAQLRSAGVGIVLTCFSTDNVSLNYLREHGVDKLKVDRAFINALGSVTEARSIIGALVNLVHTLKIGMVVEGVETVEEYEMLKDIGCTEFQGPLISPALAPGQMRSLLACSSSGMTYDDGDRAKVGGF